jgi:hypothetical protein
MLFGKVMTALMSGRLCVFTKESKVIGLDLRDTGILPSTIARLTSLRWITKTRKGFFA